MMITQGYVHRLILAARTRTNLSARQRLVDIAAMTSAATNGENEAIRYAQRFLAEEGDKSGAV